MIKGPQASPKRNATIGNRPIIQSLHPRERERERPNMRLRPQDPNVYTFKFTTPNPKKGAAAAGEESRSAQPVGVYGNQQRTVIGPSSSRALPAGLRTHGDSFEVSRIGQPTSPCPPPLRHPIRLTHWLVAPPTTTAALPNHLEQRSPSDSTLAPAQCPQRQ